MKAAVIGVGPHGRRIVEILRAMPEVELAAVVDQSEQALAALELSKETARYRSADELWSRGDVALVCVATNGPSHAKLAEAAISAGARYLFVEKPMACSLDECDRILKQAAAAGTRVAVDHFRRFAPNFRWLRQQIASGGWGQLRAIWIQRPGIGLGCNATHSFDMVTMLAGAPARRVTAWVDAPLGKNPRGDQFVDPGGLVVMELEGGARAVVAQIEDGAGPTSIEIDLTGARLRLDEQGGPIEIVERDLSIKPGPGRPPVFRRGEAPEGITAKADMLGSIRQCLVELISQDGGTIEPLHGRAAVEVLVAAYLSHRRGNQPVDLPLSSAEDLAVWLPVT
jgi:predicted dehydrogenase